MLARYAKNMTEEARQRRLDPVLCRDHEIDLMIDILCRRRKNNPVVVGENELILRLNRHGNTGTVYCDQRNGSIYDIDQQSA